jgi:2-keto-4-pentenoate hydratase/2-oxohepta-3-ene-1,7-dioic acid hydratase in catechol pathway
VRITEYVGDDGSPTLGVVIANGISPVGLGTMHDLLQQPDWQATIAIHDTVGDLAIDDVTFRPMLGDTGRVFAAGLNYNKIYPAGKPPPTPKFPPWFSKLPGTLVGHNESVVAPRVSETFDYEAELAAVIGIGGRHITVEQALDHVVGWTCLNDGSVREWQRHSVNAGKNFERSGSIGPWMVTADEIADPQNLRLSARVDGETRQDASTGEMIFSVAEIISYLSQSIELRPGDVIATGSPEGTGGSFDPPKFLVAGQQLDVEIEGIGVLSSTVVAEADYD